MANDREIFEEHELAKALSRYDLGSIRSIEEFSRGSRKAPKAIIEAEKGKFLFKRRARGKDELEKVAFTHQIQLTLSAQSFPLPHLIGTRGDNNSILMLDGKIYELFEFISGGGYDGSLASTFHSGHVLGLYHKLLETFKSDYVPSHGSYHNADTIHQSIRNTVRSLPLESRPSGDVVTRTIGVLEEAYEKCAEKVDSLGLDQWPTHIVHGDWHPGNMLFRDRHVVAVVDYDAARLQQRAIDLANGALQFSILGGTNNPHQWPEHVDETRFQRFLRGYDSVCVISRKEIEAIPYLMCEAMIAESVLPIAATGRFGRIDGFPFLQMVERKVNWIFEHLDEMLAVLKD